MRLISLSGLFDGPSIPERVTRRKTKPNRSFGRWNSPQDDRAKAGPAALPPGTRSGGGCPQDDRAKAGSDPPPRGAVGDGTALGMTLGRPERRDPFRNDNNSRPVAWPRLCPYAVPVSDGEVEGSAYALFLRPLEHHGRCGRILGSGADGNAEDPGAGQGTMTVSFQPLVPRGWR